MAKNRFTVVDENGDEQEVTRAWLNRNGYSVEGAERGQLVPDGPQRSVSPTELPGPLDIPADYDPQPEPTAPTRPGGILNLQWAAANGGTLPTTPEQWAQVDSQFPGLPWTAPAPPTAPTAPTNPQVDTDIFNELFGLGTVPQIGRTVLPDTPQVSSTYSPEFHNWWLQNQAQAATDLSKFYDWGDWPTMQAAQLNLRDIPRAQAEQFTNIPQAQAALLDTNAIRRANTPQWDLSGLPTMQAAQLNPNQVPQIQQRQAQIAQSQAAQLDPNSIYRPTAQTSQAAQFDLSSIPEIAAIHAQAAQRDLSTAPQYSAQTPESFSGLDWLMSGQGLGDDAMTRLRAQAIDDVSNAARSNRGAARLALQNANLQGSGADVALDSQINRRAGEAQTKALNQLAIEDAVRGLENRRLGTGMELERRTNAAGMQNQAGQFNASNALQLLLSNLSNEQQANLINAAAGNRTNEFNAANRINAQGQNVANQQQTNLANQGAQNQMEAFNASNLLNALLTNTQNQQQTNLTNTAATNQGNQFNAGLGAETDRVNAANLLSVLMGNTAMQQQANQTNTQNQMTAQGTNINNAQQAALQHAANVFAGQQQNTTNQQATNTQNAQNQFGAGMQNTQNRQQVNLQNAQNLLNAMNTNVGNQQQTNVINTQNQQDRNMARAGAQTALQSNLSGQYGTAALGRASEADFFNAGNQINQNLNQAQLDRQRDMFNTGTGENRYGQAFNVFGNLISGSNAVPYFNAAQPNYQPNLTGANTWSNIGNTLLTNLLNRWPQPQQQQQRPFNPE